MALVIGQEFGTFEEFAEHLKRWEETNFVTLYTRRSHSIEAVRRRAPNRSFADKLKFSELDYACVHGGREYKIKSNTEEAMSKVRVLFTKGVDKGGGAGGAKAPQFFIAV